MTTRAIPQPGNPPPPELLRTAPVGLRPVDSTEADDTEDRDDKADMEASVEYADAVDKADCIERAEEADRANTEFGNAVSRNDIAS